MKDINLLSEQEQIKLIKEDVYNLKNIKNPSEKVKLEAVKTYGCVIQYIDNPSYELQLIAVKQDSHAIQYIDNPSRELRDIAINKNCSTIKYLKTLDFDIISNIDIIRCDSGCIYVLKGKEKNLFSIYGKDNMTKEELINIISPDNAESNNHLIRSEYFDILRKY